MPVRITTSATRRASSSTFSASMVIVAVRKNAGRGEMRSALQNWPACRSSRAWATDRLGGYIDWRRLPSSMSFGISGWRLSQSIASPRMRCSWTDFASPVSFDHAVTR